MPQPPVTVVPRGRRRCELRCEPRSSTPTHLIFYPSNCRGCGEAAPEPEKAAYTRKLLENVDLTKCEDGMLLRNSLGPRI